MIGRLIEGNYRLNPAFCLPGRTVRQRALRAESVAVLPRILKHSSTICDRFHVGPGVLESAETGRSPRSLELLARGSRQLLKAPIGGNVHDVESADPELATRLGDGTPVVSGGATVTVDGSSGMVTL